MSVCRITSVKDISVNKKAYFNYFVEETYEAGISLEGGEVKSVREGKVSIAESFALISDGSVWLKNAHIAYYEKSSAYNTRDTRRDRRLLLHKSEIAKLNSKVTQKGYTLVPLKFYFEKSLVKVLLGLCKGKQTYDKREAIAERSQKRDEARDYKRNQTL